MVERRPVAGSGTLRTDRMQCSLLAVVGSAAVEVWLSEKLELAGLCSSRTDQMQRSLRAAAGSAAAVGV